MSSMYDQTVVGKTKKGKEIAYRVKHGESLYSIYFVTGGIVPSELTGSWTDTRQIEIAIACYLNKDKLSPQDQEKKDFRAGVNAAKRRPSMLKQKSKE